MNYKDKQGRERESLLPTSIVNESIAVENSRTASSTGEKNWVASSPLTPLQINYAREILDRQH